MASVTASSGVKLKASTSALSGSTTLTGNNSGKSEEIAVITASGKPTKGGGAFSAGSNNGWSLSVTYNSDGTARGSAAGSYQGVTGTAVPIQVDAPGRPRHKKKTKRKSVSKGSAKSSKTRKKKPAARKKTPTRRKKSKRR